MTPKFWLVALLALTLTGVVSAAPMTGEMAPAFRLKTIAGDAVELASFTAKSPVVLVMLRGYPGYQCPWCTRQVGEFAGHAAEFAAKGVRVVMVYPGAVAGLEQHAKEFLANKEWPSDFVLLLDPDYTFTQAYGLRWDAPKETAYPATFVIGQDGKVQWSKISRTHGDRATAAEVLAQLRGKM
jgi:peroxiredoxin